MRQMLHACLIAALLTAPMLAPIAWSLMAVDAQPRGLATRHGGVLVHGVATNPGMLPSGTMVLVDGIAVNPGALRR
jgi:hypothetical protein